MPEIQQANIRETHIWRGWRVVAPLALVLVAFVLGAWNAHWRQWNRLDELPEQWDEAHFISMSIRLNDKMRRDPAAAYNYFVNGSPNQAPFTSLGASFLYYIFPRSVQTALDFNVICLAVLLVSVYFIGARKSLATGVLAAVTVACLIPVLQYMRLSRTELPLAAWVALAILCIQSSERFKWFLPTLAAGAVCGVAALTNPIAMVFLLAPALYALVRGLAESKLEPLRIVNFVIGLAVAFGIAQVWYLPNQEEIQKFLLGYGFGPQGEAFRQGHPWFTLYPRLILGDIGWGFLVVAAVAIILALLSRVSAQKKNAPTRKPLDVWLIVVWVAAAYIFLNLTRDQQTRFLLPLLPGAAILLGALIASIRWKAAVAVTAALLALACAGGLYGAFSQPLTQIREVDITKERDWKLKEIAEAIAKEAGDKRPTVAFLANHALFTAKGFDLAALLDGHDFNVVYVGEVESEEAKLIQVGLRLAESDYAIFKTGKQMEAHATHRDIPVEKAQKLAAEMKYVPLKQFTLPDGSQALLLKRKQK